MTEAMEMNGTKKKVTLETLYNTLFTIGIMILMGTMALIQDGELDGAITPLIMGISLIIMGAFIYWLKIQEPKETSPLDDLKTPEQVGLPATKPKSPKEGE